PHRQVAGALELLRSGADHDPVVLAHRNSQQPVPDRAADQVDLHGAHGNRDRRTRRARPGRPRRCCARRAHAAPRRGRRAALGLRDALSAAGGERRVAASAPARADRFAAGRSADPVLSSMLGYGDDELAATIFHELAHQLLYVRDDSQFNEAFASTVEDEGLERWLRHLGAGERLRQLRERDADAAAFADLMAQARSRLARLYASGAPRVEMRARKAEVLAGLAGKMRALEQRRGVTYPLYEDW